MSNPRPYPDINWAAQFEKARQEERAHVVSNREDVAASGGTSNIHFANPSGNHKEYHVHSFILVTQFRGQVTIYDTFSSAPTGGTSLTVDNLRMDTEDVNGMGTANANSNATYTASGSPHVEAVIPSGGEGGNTIGGQIQATSPIIEPGREIVIQVTNSTSTSRPASLGVIYSEQPH